jgi:hypothetical protein
MIIKATSSGKANAALRRGFAFGRRDRDRGKHPPQVTVIGRIDDPEQAPPAETSPSRPSRWSRAARRSRILASTDGAADLGPTTPRLRPGADAGAGRDSRRGPVRISTSASGGSTSPVASLGHPPRRPPATRADRHDQGMPSSSASVT